MEWQNDLYNIMTDYAAKANTPAWNDDVRGLFAHAFADFDKDFADKTFADFVDHIEENGTWKHGWNWLKLKYRFAESPLSREDYESDFTFMLGQLQSSGYAGSITLEDMDRFKDLMVQQYSYHQNKKTRDFFGVTGSFRLRNPLVLLQMDNATQFWREHNNTLYEDAVRIVVDEIHNGVHPSKMAGRKRVYDENGEPIYTTFETRLNRLLGEKTAYEIERFARTESAWLLNMANADHYKYNSDIYEHKRWVAVPDEKGRHSHKRMNSHEPIPVGGEYEFVTDDGEVFSIPFPAHSKLPVKERVNCRCAEIATVKRVPDGYKWWDGD